MKTAALLPVDVSGSAERLAKQTKKSRRELYSDALHSPDGITEAMNRVCDEIGDTRDPFISAAGRRILEQTES